MRAAILLVCLVGVCGRKTSLSVTDDVRPGYMKNTRKEMWRSSFLKYMSTRDALDSFLNCRFLVEPFCFAGGGSLKFDVSEFSLTNMDGKAVQPTKVGMIVRKVLLWKSQHISFPKALVQEYLMLHTQGRRRRYALCHHKRR